LLSTTWNVLRARWAFFIGLGLVVSAVGAFLSYGILRFFIGNGVISSTTMQILAGNEKALGLSNNPTDAEIQRLVGYFAEIAIYVLTLAVAAAVVQLVCSALVSRATLELAHGRKINLAEVFSSVSWFRILTTSLLVGLVSLAPIIPGLVILVAGAGNFAIAAIGLFAIIAGLPFSIVLTIGLTPYIAVVLYEGVYNFSAVRRTLKLTKGSRASVFAVSFVTAIMASIVGGVPSMGLTVIETLTHANAANSLLLTTMGSFASYVITLPVAAIVSTLIFINLRVTNEPATANEIFVTE